MYRAALIGLLFCAAAQAETLSGRVIAIADGDTITVLDEANRQHKIRLAGIDAPEKASKRLGIEVGQPFGERSKEHLSDLTFNKQVTVEWNKKDRYGRTVGKVLVNGVDANLEQIKAGMAWWYEKYRKEQSKADQYIYSAQETDARQRRIGLWRDPSPVPPWEWRRQLKNQGEMNDKIN